MHTIHVSTTVLPPNVQHGHNMTERVNLSGQRTVRPERVVHVGVDDGGVGGVGDNGGGSGSSRKAGFNRSMETVCC